MSDVTPEHGSTSDLDRESHAVNAVRWLAPREIRARTRPRTWLLLYIAQFAWALVVVTPLHAWAQASWGAHPDGDLVLFRTEATELLEWLANEGPARGIVMRSTLALFVLGCVVGQALTGALLMSLALGRGPRGRELSMSSLLKRAISAFVPLGTLSVLTMLVQVACMALFVATSSPLADALASRWDEASILLLRAVFVGLGAGVTLVIGTLADVARCFVVRSIETARLERLLTPRIVFRAWATTVRLPPREMRRAIGAWAARAAVSTLAVTLAALLLAGLPRAIDGSLAVFWAVHQVVVLGRLALRGSWLARAMTLAASASPPGSDDDLATAFEGSSSPSRTPA